MSNESDKPSSGKPGAPRPAAPARPPSRPASMAPPPRPPSRPTSLPPRAPDATPVRPPSRPASNASRPPEPPPPVRPSSRPPGPPPRPARVPSVPAPAAAAVENLEETSRELPTVPDASAPPPVFSEARVVGQDDDSEESSAVSSPELPQMAGEEELHPTIELRPQQKGGVAPLTHEQAGRYTIVREFGRGGQSVVYLATDAHIGRQVAFKQLLQHGEERGGSSSDGRSTASVEARFLREARITGQLEHPGIVPVYEVGARPDGSLYYTQRLVRGRTIGDALERCKTLQDRLKLLGHFLAVCQAIAYAHGRGVIHRDLKPDNVMVGEFGEAVVLDWGLAKIRGQDDPRAAHFKRAAAKLQNSEHTMDGSVMGTPAYMSPEQARGEIDAHDERSDVWSLGAMLFELLTGRRPFEGRTGMEIVLQVQSAEVPKVAQFCKEAPRDLAAVAERALSRDLGVRYRSAKELAAEIEAFLGGRRVGAHDYSSLELIGKFVRRNRAASSVALVAVLLLTSAALALAWKNAQSETNLSAVLVEKARAAAQQLQWDKAAVYAAAARGHRDLPDARWRSANRGAIDLVPEGSYKPAKGEPERAVLSADGKLTAVLVYDGTDRSIVVLKLTGSDARSRRAPPVTLHALAAAVDFSFSPDGKTLAVLGDAGAVRLFATDTGEETSRIVSGGWVERIAFSPDGRTLALGEESGAVQLADLASPGNAQALRPLEKGVSALAFSSDGKLLAAGGNELRIYDTESFAQVGRFAARADALAFSPDGKRIALASSDNALRVLKLGSFAQVAEVLPLSAEQVSSFSLDGRRFIVRTGDTSFVVGDVKSARLIARVDRATLPVVDAALSADGRFAVAVADGEARVFRIDEGRRVIDVGEGQSRATSAFFMPDGRLVGWGAVDGKLHLADLAGAERGGTPPERDAPLTWAGATGDGKLFATADEQGLLAVFDPASKRDAATVVDPSGGLRLAAFLPGGKALLSLGEDHVLRVRDTQTLRELRKLGSGDEKWTAVALSPDGALAAGGLDKTITIFDAKDGKQLASFNAPAGVSVLAFSQDGKKLLAGCRDRELRVFSRKGELLLALSGHRAIILGAAFSPDGALLASSSWDGTVRLWDASSGQEVFTARRTTATTVTFSPDGKWLASAGASPPLQLIEVEPPAQLPTPAADLKAKLARYHLRLQALTLVEAGPDEQR